MDTEGKEGSYRQIHKAAFQEAQEAADRGDPVSMVRVLHQEHVLASVVRRVSFRWKLDLDTAHDIAAQVMRELYVHVRDKSSPVKNVGGFLVWRIDKRAYDHKYSDYNRLIRVFPPADLEMFDAAIHFDVYDTDNDRDQYEEDPQEFERKRKELFVQARQAVPLIGEERLQSVMLLVLEGLEANHSVTNRHIADTLGMTIDTAKALKSRAIDRFIQRAHEVGLPGVAALGNASKADKRDGGAADKGPLGWEVNDTDPLFSDPDEEEDF